MQYDQTQEATDAGTESRRAPNAVIDHCRGQPGDEAFIGLCLFGAFSAWNSRGDDVLPRGRKAQAILAYLTASGEPVVTRQRLTGLLWSRRGEEQARASLRQSLMELKRAIRGVDATLLCIDRGRVRLDHTRVRLNGLASVFGGTRPADPDRFLESLRGLDEAFDRWIDARRSSLHAPPQSADEAALPPWPPAVEAASDAWPQRPR